MATVSQAERRAAMDILLQTYGEDYQQAATVMRYLTAAIPGMDWMNYLRQRAAIYQPFIDSGLSINWWLDEVQRLMA